MDFFSLILLILLAYALHSAIGWGGVLLLGFVAFGLLIWWLNHETPTSVDTADALPVTIHASRVTNARSKAPRTDDRDPIQAMHIQERLVTDHSAGVSSALIVESKPLASLLSGAKDWEMRTTHCHKREVIGLIEKGTGHVHGVARIVGSLGPLTDEDLLANTHRHGVTADRIRGGALMKRRFAWVVEDVQRLNKPVPYAHRSGQVKFVTLDERAKALIHEQIGDA